MTQLLTYSRRVPVAEMCDRIDEVDTDAIRRVATRLFGPNSGNKPSIVAMGQEDVGDYKAVLRKYAVASG
jgi:processing peptidase subunit alpha